MRQQKIKLDLPDLYLCPSLSPSSWPGVTDLQGGPQRLDRRIHHPQTNHSVHQQISQNCYVRRNIAHGHVACLWPGYCPNGHPPDHYPWLSCPVSRLNSAHRMSKLQIRVWRRLGRGNCEGRECAVRGGWLLRGASSATWEMRFREGSCYRQWQSL